MKVKNYVLLFIFCITLLFSSCTAFHAHEYINGKCSCGRFENPQELNTYTVTFRDYEGNIINIVKIKPGDNLSIPDAPKKEGYKFIGWSHDLNNITTDLEVTAIYEKLPIYVGENHRFKTLNEAIDNAVDGDVIYITDGIYEGAIINKSVEIRGNNFNVISNGSRNNETTFTSDLIVNSSNVVINGISLTGKARITFDNLTSDVSNIKICYSKVFNSTVNNNNERNTAPFNLVSNNNYYLKNITIDNCYIEQVVEPRAMVMYVVDVENLTVENSFFFGARYKKVYNDAIKVDNEENGKAKFGIKGNVIIRNNVFKNYSQYGIWFRQYSTGSYIIENNYFDNIGQSPDSHAAVNFIKSVDCKNVEINIINNKVINSHLLFRIDELSCDNAICNVNKNSLVYSLGKYYIINKVNDLTVNAKENYYGENNIDINKFIGSVDYSTYYNDYYELKENKDIEVYFETTSYVEVGKSINLLLKLYGLDNNDIYIFSNNLDIATVDNNGIITGVSEGTAEIIIRDINNIVEKNIYVEVYKDTDKMDEVAKYVLSIMNNYSKSVTAANSRTNYAVTDPYLYSIYRSATSYLFEDLIIDSESYKRDGLAPLVNNKVEYITIHDTWALQRTAKGIAEFFLTDETSIHYAVGNDGLYQIIRLTDKAAHAGDSPYRAYALDKTSVVATTNKPIITMIDGFFAINGIKTDFRPYKDYEGTIFDSKNYTTEQITYSGIRCVIGDDGYYYLGKTYFNTTYNTISNFGGNANSIGIEMESQKGTDFYLNMQRTAKLVATLLDKYNLTTNDVKMHNYFSGKNCAQLLKNNLKDIYDYQIDKHNIEDTLWDEFLDLCDVELTMLRYAKEYKFEFISSDTSILSNSGRVIGHSTTTKSIPYTIRITNKKTNEVIELNSSIIISNSINIGQSYMNV